MTAKNLIILISSVCLCACTSHTIYSHFEPVPIHGWETDSVLQYDVAITDTVTPYDILIYVRHTEAYPYQNMWLFTQKEGQRDTIEFYLADDRGQWLGNYSGKLIEMPVLYEQNYVFSDTGIYTITIQHGMRDRALKGISDVGVIVREYGQE